MMNLYSTSNEIVLKEEIKHDQMSWAIASREFTEVD